MSMPDPIYAMLAESYALGTDEINSWGVRRLSQTDWLMPDGFKIRIFTEENRLRGYRLKGIYMAGDIREGLLEMAQQRKIGVD